MPKLEAANAKALGVDLVEVARIARLIEEQSDRFLQRVYTPREQQHGRDSRRWAEHLAARFAAKEAALKAIGTGWRYGIAWTDVEVVTDGEGKPGLVVTGKAAEFARARGIEGWLVSLSHTETTAMATVIGLGPAEV